MAHRRYIGEAGEGQPLNWKAALNHPDGWIPGFQDQVQWVRREGADRNSAVYLVDDAGHALPSRQAQELTSRIYESQRATGGPLGRKERKAAQKAAARQQVQQQRQAERRSARHSTIAVGLVFWTVCLIAGISGHLGVGFLAMWILLSPLWVFVMGVIGRMFLAALRW